MAIFDTHAHYPDEQFDGVRDGILEGLAGKGVSLVLNCASGLVSAAACVELADKYDFCYAAVGVHPHEIEGLPQDYEAQLELMAKNRKVVAIGEIGLDYYYDLPYKDKQIEAFERQILLAARLDLPIVIHDRDAHQDVYELLIKHRPRGVIHRYSGSAAQAVQLAELGFYLGFGGAVTYKNSKSARASAVAVPLDRLLLETDCPYMPPSRYRGQRCTSDMIADVAQVIAELRGVDCGELIETAAQNGRDLFNIK